MEETNSSDKVYHTLQFIRDDNTNHWYIKKSARTIRDMDMSVLMYGPYEILFEKESDYFLALTQLKDSVITTLLGEIDDGLCKPEP